ncbi:molybdopterin molybdotransferase MoeA [Phytohabitans houttuyneae]|uniref:Molybdopterin molybdenumtransferase n=1 Tax=Phytohabitans houttuyneae TaxID=1076126 RepID=A0A6V8KAV7_9ACTN|nr:molybdopterin molybdotransferase MoeA [Phytohabitans houttuyneae]GFJ79591.1 molybdopterin molybdenumtransferase MoeA [Phytohabitans houttuyneae]
MPDLAMPWDRARALAAGVSAMPGTERVLLAEAAGRVLAAPLRAAVPAPAFDTAAMDGFAVAGPGPWRIGGRVLAGGPGWVGELAEGEAVEIATGAIVPATAEAVLPYEECQVDGDLVRGARKTKDHIRRAGEDARPGDELVPAGRIVTAAVLGAAAQAGAGELTVHRRPSVAVLVTGDEVVTSGLPGPGQVRDALSPIVTALVTRAGGQPVAYHHLRDGAGLLRTAIETTDAEVVVVTGSSSAGAADHLGPVLSGLGARRLVDGVRCRPGHPQALAVTADGRWVVGLPGNPFAGLVAGLTILEPLVASLAGRSLPAPATLPVFGAGRPYPDGVRLAPVEVSGGQARILPGARAGSLRAAAMADAVAVLEPDWVTGSSAAVLPVP